MKKYLLGLFALVFALSMVAFTNAKRATLDFIFVGTDLTNQSQVNDPNLWESGSATILCSNNNVRACGIVTVPDSYYHQVGSKQVLNDATYASEHEGEIEMEITSQLVSGGSTYFVSAVSAGTARNKN